MINIAVLIISLLLSVSVSAEYCDGKIGYLKSIIQADAVEDAKQSLVKGDNDYLATFGYTYNIPGVPTKEYNKIIESKRFKPIEGSGDNLCTWPGSPKDLGDQIQAYAKLYNQTICHAK